MKFDSSTTYKEILKECNRDTLIDLATVLGYSNNLEELEATRIDTLRRRVNAYVFDHAAEWIHELPLNDLQMMQMLIDNGRTIVEDTGQGLIAEALWLIQYEDGGEDSELEMFVTDDISQLVAPLLDDAIARKQQNGIDIMEQALNGVLNLVGCMPASLITELLQKLLPAHDSRLTAKAINDFMAHSMLVRYNMGGELDDGDTMLYSNLVESSWWVHDIRDVEPYVPTDIEEILAHGSYPYFTPTRPCEKAFYQLLRDLGGCDHEEALNDFTFYYGELQDANVHQSALTAEIINVCNPTSDADTNRVLKVVMDFSNGIPKFFLRGQSSAQVSGFSQPEDISLEGLWRSRTPERPATATSPGIDLPLPLFPMRKVGRNDPCPCGSGKTYKNCCGMEN